MDNPEWGDDWPEVRAEWALDRGVAHLNHGSFGAAPTPVLDARAELLSELEHNPVQFFRRKARHAMEDARQAAAFFCGAEDDGFVFVQNTTAGISTVLNHFPLKPNDELVVTEHAYESVRVAAQRACRSQNAILRVVNVPIIASDTEIVELIMASVGPRTRLVIVDQITCRTAMLFPVAELVRQLHERDVPVLVDAAHTPGMLPVDLSELAPDFWVGSFHKWAGAPPASAGLYIAKHWRNQVEPLIASRMLDGKIQQLFSWPGTFDPTLFIVIPVALDFMAKLGWERLREYNRTLAFHGHEVVAKAINMSDHDLIEPQIAMSAVRLPHGVGSTTDGAEALQDRIAVDLSAETTVTAWRRHGWLRLSAQVYNTYSEYEELAERLPGLLASLDESRESWT
jgi:isopenicillin-N epimerase